MDDLHSMRSCALTLHNCDVTPRGFSKVLLTLSCKAKSRQNSNVPKTSDYSVAMLTYSTYRFKNEGTRLGVDYHQHDPEHSGAQSQGAKALLILQ